MLGLQLNQKQTSTHVFSCEICEIFKNIFFIEQLRTTAFVCKKKTNQKSTIQQCTLMFRHNQQYKIQDTNKIQDQKN